MLRILIAKYASKSERMSSVAKDTFTNVLQEASYNSDNNRIITTLMMRAIGQRDMGVQETSTTISETCEFLIPNHLRFS